jgi:hypothetical protein
VDAQSGTTAREGTPQGWFARRSTSGFRSNVLSSSVDENTTFVPELASDPFRGTAIAARVLVLAIAATSLALLANALVVRGEGVPGADDLYSPNAEFFNRFAAGAFFPLLTASLVSIVSTLVRLARQRSRHPVNDLVIFIVTIPISLEAYRVWAGMGW